MLKRNLIANYLGQGWVALMGLAFIPLYIKYLGIESYGLIGLFALLQTWLTLLDMGMSPTLGREMARYTGGTHSAESIRDLLRSIEVVAVGVAVLIVVGIALSANWLATSWLQAEKLPVSEVAQAFVIMGAVTALRFIEGIYRSSIAGLQRQVLLNVLSSALATVRAFGAVSILIWVSPTIEAFFLWQGITALISLVILALATYGALPRAERGGRFSIAALRRVWKFAGGMMGITMLALLLTTVDKMLLSKLLALTEYGYYTLAAVIAGALYMLVGPITAAWFPRLSQLHAAGDHEGLVRKFHQGAQLVSVIAGSAALVIMTFAETLLHLWTQDAALAQRTAPLLSLLVLGNLLNALCWIPYQTQLAHGWTSLAVRVNIVAVLIIVPAILWITPIYGAIGAACVWIGLNTGYVLVSMQLMYRRILRAEKWSWYWLDNLQPLISIGIVILLLKWQLPAAKTVITQVGTLMLASTLALATAILSVKELRKYVSTLIKSYFL